MTRRRDLLKAAGAGALLAAPAVHAQTEHNWKLVTSWPKNSPGPGITARRLGERIEQLSGGRIRVTLYAAGELVSAFQVLDAVGGGTAELGHTAAVFWQGKHPASAFFMAVPFGLLPLEHMAWVYHGGGQALWDELYGDFGAKPFMAGNTGPSMGGWFRREIEGLDDIRGLKYRMPGLGGEVFRRLGGTPVSIPPGETLAALQAGTIDGAEFAAPWSDLALGFHQVAPYYYWPGWHEPNGTGECLINRRLWDELPDDLRAVVEHACATENAYALAEAEWHNAAALQTLVEEHGTELRAFPDEVLAAMRETTEAVMRELAEQDDLTRRIHQSHEIARQRAIALARVSSEAFQRARAG